MHFGGVFLVLVVAFSKVVVIHPKKVDGGAAVLKVGATLWLCH